jgi:hypothetical protein
MLEANMGNTFKRMTESALDKTIASAERKGEDFVKRGRYVAPLRAIKAIQARVKGWEVPKDPHPSGEIDGEGDEGLEMEREPMPDTPVGYVTGDSGGPGGVGLFARDDNQGLMLVERDGWISDGGRAMAREAMADAAAAAAAAEEEQEEVAELVERDDTPDGLFVV